MIIDILINTVQIPLTFILHPYIDTHNIMRLLISLRFSFLTGIKRPIGNAKITLKVLQNVSKLKEDKNIAIRSGIGRSPSYTVSTLPGA